MKRSIPSAAVAVSAATLALAAVLLLSGCSSPASVQSPSQKAPSPSTTATNGAVAAQQPVPAEKNPPGDIPDNQAFVAYSAAGGFSVKVPEGWSRTQSTAGVEFSDKLNTIRVAWTPASAAPTVASVNNVDLPKLKASEAAFDLVDVKAVNLPAGSAVRTTYRENGVANAVTGKQYRLDVERYTVFKNGTRVDLTLLSPVGSDNADPWRIVSQSLTWK
jgi:hypothetical protein